MQIEFTEVILLFIECLIFSCTILFLFGLRKVMGLGLLFASLGVFQFMQVFLANTVHIELAPGFIISPGSVVLFSGSLFAILLIYIREDALEARKLIYALLAANIVMTIFQLMFGYNLNSTSIISSYDLPPNFFFSNARILIVGTVLLFFDCILVIVLYEFISQKIKSLFVRMFLTMVIVLSFDSILFSLIAFSASEFNKELIFAGIVSKVAAALVYTFVFSLYLVYFEKNKYSSNRYTFNDIFSLLTYRQKYEQLTIENELILKESEKSRVEHENRYQNIFNFSPVGLLEMDLSKVYAYLKELQSSGVESLAEYFRKYPDELLKLALNIRILNANQATVNIFEAESKEDLTNNLIKTFTNNSLDVFKKEIISLVEGKNNYFTTGEVLTLKGRIVHVQFSFNIISKGINDRSLVMVALSDISSRVNSERALKKSEFSLKESQRIGKLGSWEIELSSQKVSWSDELFRIFNLKPQEYEPDLEKFRAFIYPEDLELAEGIFNEAIKNKQGYELDHRVLLQNNTIKYVKAKVRIQYNTDGQPVRLMGTLNDITDIVKANKEQKELAYRNKLILDTTLDGFLLINEKGEIVETNEAYSKLVGYGVGELKGMNLSGLESRYNSREILEKMKQISISGGNQFETAHRAKNGDVVELNVSASIMYYNGQKYFASFCRDITERKQAEDTLRKSESQYRSIVTNANVCIHEIDGNGYFLSMNPSGLEIIGAKSESEIVGQKFTNLICDNDQLRVQNLFYSAINEAESSNFEFKSADNRKYLSSCFIPINEKGKVKKIIGITSDITERVHARKELNANLEFLQNALDSVQDGISLLNKDGSHVHVNPSLCAMTGYTKEELEGTSPPHLYWPEEEYSNIEKAFALTMSGKRGGYELLFKNKDNKRFPVIVSPSPIRNEDDEIINYIATIKDISYIRQLDKWKILHGNILELAARGATLDAIISNVIKGVDNLISGAMSSVIMLNEMNQPKNIGDSRLPEEWMTIMEAFGSDSTIKENIVSKFGKSKIISQQITNDSVWGELGQKAKQYGLLSCWAEPIVSLSDNRAIGLLTIYFTDSRTPSEEEMSLMTSVTNILSILFEKFISEQQLINYKYHLENLVEQRTIELEKRNEELESFSYTVSHDLRAPLTRIDGFGKAILDSHNSQLDKKGRHYLERIRVGIRTMASIIEDILTLSRVSRQHMTKIKVNLSEVSISVLNELSKSVPDFNVRTTVQPDLMAEMDPGLSRLLMENLLSNAWKFTRNASHPTIKIGSCLRNGSTWFYVNDNGVGFDMKYYNQIFEPFSRLHSVKEFEGSGIGLATVKRILEKHDGQIEAESSINGGATFYFKI